MTPSASSEYCPFYLVFGEDMNLPFGVNLIPREDLNKNLKTHIDNILDNLKIAKAIATENLNHAQQKQKTNYYKRTELPKFEVNDQILMFTPKVPVEYSSKLYKKQDGPFYIVDKGSNYMYKLRKCSDHELLKNLPRPVQSQLQPQQEAQQPPIDDDDDDDDNDINPKDQNEDQEYPIDRFIRSRTA
ncbi:unnamed protein product [Mytilus edulis]|uniref:Uncharacterized protein n=1 Tax=Mytilus edulis TaxID=6550 RepID=A0A8S3RR76_MYTED|nr:unnamed protein product [Mytilus edulis]